MDKSYLQRWRVATIIRFILTKNIRLPKSVQLNNKSMRYYSIESFDKLDNKYKQVLQKYFPNSNKWGVCVLFDEKGQPETFEICALHDANVNGATWEHYANIARYDDGTWEVNTQFNGEKENEMWIFGYWKRFVNAVRIVACGNFEKMKPLKIY